MEPATIAKYTKSKGVNPYTTEPLVKKQFIMNYIIALIITAVAINVILGGCKCYVSESLFHVMLHMSQMGITTCSRGVAS